MVRTVLFCLLVCLFSFLSGNVAQPGIYSAGGTGTFSLLFPGDSLAFDQVEMQQEKIVAQLYPGFAVVKGSYWMYNTATDTVRMQVGYPVNASYASQFPDLMDISFDDLYRLKVRMDEQELALVPQRLEEENWYVWEQTFAPGKQTLIEVFFLVNTNDASVLKGYNKDHHNAFLYLLETGKAWKGAIGAGEILLQLMEGLTLDELWGGQPENDFRYLPTEKILYYTFKDLEPTPTDNIALVYGERVETFDFGAVSRKAERYFAQVEALSQRSFDPVDLESVSLGDAFEVHSIDTFSVVVWTVLIGVPILVILVLVALVQLILRRRKRT